MSDFEQKLEELREEEILDLIRRTVDQLNDLGDRLEEYVEQQEKY